MAVAVDACAVLTTLPGREVASQLAHLLVEQQLAACVQLLAIDSVYRWQGAVQQDAEVLLIIKTRASRYADVEHVIKVNHPYSVPQILQLPVQNGLADYLHWLAAEVPAR